MPGKMTGEGRQKEQEEGSEISVLEDPHLSVLLQREAGDASVNGYERQVHYYTSPTRA